MIACSLIMLLLTIAASPLAAQEGTPRPRNSDLLRVVGLRGAAQREALRSLLSSDSFRTDYREFLDSIFFYEDSLRPALRSLLRDKKSGHVCAGILALIGVRDDVRAIIRSPPPSTGGPDDDDLVRAAALVDPQSRDEWAFIHKCALHDHDGGWEDDGAVQTLRLSTSARSVGILVDVREKNQRQADAVERALAYRKSNPLPFAGLDLETLASRVARAIDVGNWVGSLKPRYNEAEDKALVDSTFISGGDRYTYTATFHKTQGRIWRLRGVRETMQALMPPSPPTNAIHVAPPREPQ